MKPLSFYAFILMLAMAVTIGSSWVHAQTETPGTSAAAQAPVPEAAQAPVPVASPASEPAETKPVEAKPADATSKKPELPGKPADLPEKPLLETMPPSSTGAADDSEYEIDYEEEPGTDGEEPVEAPVPKKNGTRKKNSSVSAGGGVGGIQGSRAKHRFTPILKSETKSVYKKDGKALDVDSD